MLRFAVWLSVCECVCVLCILGGSVDRDNDDPSFLLLLVLCELLRVGSPLPKSRTTAATAVPPLPPLPYFWERKRLLGWCWPVRYRLPLPPLTRSNDGEMWMYVHSSSVTTTATWVLLLLAGVYNSSSTYIHALPREKQSRVHVIARPSRNGRDRRSWTAAVTGSADLCRHRRPLVERVGPDYYAVAAAATSLLSSFVFF